MTGYVLKLGLAMVAILIGGVIAIVVFSDIWARIGIGAAIVVLGGALLLLAWNVDRRDKARRAGVDELPRV
jgi:Flp pilus assembly protein TadB